MKIGLALSGGGVRSASQLGIIQALHENGVVPTVFAGTSGGSIVATLLAIGHSPEGALTKFKETNDVTDVAYWHILRGIITRKGFDGVIKGDRLLKSLSVAFGSRTISSISAESEDTSLAIVTTSINDGKQIIFTNSSLDISKINDDNFEVINDSHLSLSPIVASSCSLPGMFVPRYVAGIRLVDGGITNNLPSDVTLAMGADKVISIDLGYTGMLKEELHGVYSILKQSVDIMMERIVDRNIEDYGVYLNPKIYDVSVLELERVDECFERGYEYGKENMGLILKYLEGDA